MHCVEHLAGMNCVLPQINQIRDQFDEFVCNRACRCLHSITLPSLTILRTPTSTNWSGWRRSKAGDRAPAQPRHVAQVAVAWHRRGCPVPGPPLSPLPRCSLASLTAARRSPNPPSVRRVGARAAPPESSQSTPGRPPLSSSRHATPLPLGNTSLATATTDADR